MKSKVTLLKFIITSVLLLCVVNLFAQGPSLNKVEYFVVSSNLDTYASIKEKGVDIGADLEYVGPVYAKVGFESFEVLEGGYFEFHLTVGTQLVMGENTQHRFYAGFTAARVWRNNAAETNPGLEAGYQYYFPSGFMVGGKITRFKRYDMQLLNWPVIDRISGYITIGYRWDWKGRGFQSKD